MNDLVACLCGGVHIAEPTPLGPMIACPEMPPGEIFFFNPRYMTPRRPPRIPRPERVW